MNCKCNSKRNAINVISDNVVPKETNCVKSKSNEMCIFQNNESTNCKKAVNFQMKCHMKSKVVTILVHCVNTWIMSGVKTKKKPKRAQKNVCGPGLQRACAHSSSQKLTQVMAQKLLTPAVRTVT